MRLFAKSLPKNKNCAGFIEIGEFIYDEYEFEDSVLLKVLQDGSVWARIADSVDKIPDLARIRVAVHELQSRILE